MRYLYFYSNLCINKIQLYIRYNTFMFLMPVSWSFSVTYLASSRYTIYNRSVGEKGRPLLFQKMDR